MASANKSDPAYQITMLSYVLFAGGILLQAAILAGLVAVLAKRDETRGTPYEGHMTWLLRTVVGLVIGVLVIVVLVFGLHLFSALWLGILLGPWYIYRVVRGGLLFINGQPIPNPEALI